MKLVSHSMLDTPTLSTYLAEFKLASQTHRNLNQGTACTNCCNYENIKLSEDNKEMVEGTHTTENEERLAAIITNK